MVGAPPAPKSSLALGAKLWVPSEEEVWQKACVVNLVDGHVIVKLDADGAEIPLTTTYYLRNEEYMTKKGIKGLDDLTQLTHLHEAAVLNSLNDRFEDDSIYTFTGPILIAVNPFKKIPGLYDETTLRHFIGEGWKQTFTANKTPHVFSTAVDAYRGLCKDKKNQTILISGESGAGKTESTKFVMKLLALAGSLDWERRSPVENQVLQSNPLLEAFGNAKTLRNDNSSRFGKFIEMQFRLENDRSVGGVIGRLAGARIQTYLLETVRVCRQLKNERNYHAFYQLAAISKNEDLVSKEGQLIITQEVAKAVGIDLNSDISYDLSGFESLSDLRLKGVNDSEEFVKTAIAMNTVGIDLEEQQEIWRLVGAVLFLGSVFFESPGGNSESSMIAESAQSTLKTVCDIIGVSKETLSACLCTRTIVVQKDKYCKPLTLVQAEDTRDALARALYGTMFLRIVQQTNLSIGGPDVTELSCGVLDIFGFECFEVNSFEQLCINFTNERLQQFFNTFIFKCEEMLYREEGIAWDPLDFPDNQDCVDLLQGKNYGVFGMLDEECLLPKGSDANYSARLKQQHKDHRRFGIIKTKVDWFTINHFAGPVSYSTQGFLEKNKDQLSLDVQETIKRSSNFFVASLFNEFLDRATEDPSGNKKLKKNATVSLEFRNQLSSLMDTVQATAPHFIRCVKPNPSNAPDKFHRKSVGEQLRYAGVLQAVQVSRAGYPVRDKHINCYKDYKGLVPDRSERKSLKAIKDDKRRVALLLESLDKTYNIPRPKHGGDRCWAVGSTLVFFKHEAYEILSSRLSELRNRTAVKIQSNWKRFIFRRDYLIQKRAASIIFYGVKCWLARRERLRLLRERSARRITQFMRMVGARKRIERKVRAIKIIQAFVRGRAARRSVKCIRDHRAAVRLQAFWRMFVFRRRYIKAYRNIVMTQLCWKRMLARRQLRLLKIQAKDASNLAAEKKLLSDRLVAANEELASLRDLVQVLETKLTGSAAEIEKTRYEAADRENALVEEIAALRSKAESILLEKEAHLREERPSGAEKPCSLNLGTSVGFVNASSPKARGVDESMLRNTDGSLEAMPTEPSTAGHVTSRTTTNESSNASPANSEFPPNSMSRTETSPLVRKEIVYEIDPQLAETNEYLLNEVNNLQTENNMLKKDTDELLTAKLAAEQLLAAQKFRTHEAEQRFECLLPHDSGSMMKLVLNSIVAPIKEAGLMVGGDILLIGEPPIVATMVLSKMPLLGRTLKDSIENCDLMDERWLQRREFDLYDKDTMSSPLRVTVLRKSEVADRLYKCDVKSRHFRYVAVCVDLACAESLLESGYIEQKLWDQFHSECRRIIITYGGHENDVDSLLSKFDAQAKVQDITCLTVEEFRRSLPHICNRIHLKRAELMDDLSKLKNELGYVAPKPKSSASPQKASRVNDYILQGISSFFGANKSRSLARAGRTGRIPPPPVSEVLVESLKGDELLLAESRDRDRSLRNGEITRWYHVATPSKTAVTFLKWARVRCRTQQFFVLAVATKAGPISTYKVRMSDEDKSIIDREEGFDSGANGMLITPSEDDPDNIEWSTAPLEAVETWKMYEGHTKVSEAPLPISQSPGCHFNLLYKRWQGACIYQL